MEKNVPRQGDDDVPPAKSRQPEKAYSSAGKRGENEERRIVSEQNKTSYLVTTVDYHKHLFASTKMRDSQGSQAQEQRIEVVCVAMAAKSR